MEGLASTTTRHGVVGTGLMVWRKPQRDLASQAGIFALRRLDLTSFRHAEWDERDIHLTSHIRRKSDIMI